MELVLSLDWKPAVDKNRDIPCGTVRITKEWNLNAIDLTVAVCQNNRDDAGKTLRRLIRSENLSESDFITVPLTQIRMVSFTTAFKLLMLLPGKKAQANREEFARILYRYYACDNALKAEIDRNATSSEWLHFLARQALAAEPAADSELGQEHASGDVYRSMVLAADLCAHSCVFIACTGQVGQAAVPLLPLPTRTLTRR